MDLVSNLLFVARENDVLLCVLDSVGGVLSIVGCASDPGVADMVCDDELQLISGSDACALLHVCCSSCGTLPVSFSR